MRDEAGGERTCKQCGYHGQRAEFYVKCVKPSGAIMRDTLCMTCRREHRRKAKATKEGRQPESTMPIQERYDNPASARSACFGCAKSMRVQKTHSDWPHIPLCRGCGVLSTKVKERPDRLTHLPVVHVGRCCYCGSEWSRDSEPSRGKHRFCSTVCCNRFKAKRRKKQLRDVWVESVTLPKLLKARGRKCQLCGRVCFGKGGRQPTMDHIIPLAKGGLHEWSNVQVACRTCNLRKSARKRGQMLLMG